MEFLHIYLLVAAAISCITAIFVTKVMQKNTILHRNSTTFIQKYLENLEHNLERSRTGITVQQFLVLQMGSPAILAFLSFFISDDRSLMLILIILGAMLPNMFLMIQKGSADKKFEDRFVGCFYAKELLFNLTLFYIDSFYYICHFLIRDRE